MKNPARESSARILEMYPMMGSTALFMKHVEQDIDSIAATNGREVRFGKRFFDLNPSEKNGVVLHEYLHCVLSHPQRAGILRLKDQQSFCPTAFNIAADALINHVIRIDSRKSNLLALPDGCIEISKIREDLTVLGIIEKDDLHPSTTKVETIYEKLMIARSLPKDNHLQTASTNSITGAQGSDSQDEDQKQGHPEAEREAADALRKQEALQRINDIFQDAPDLVPDKGTLEEMREKIREQTARLANASAYGSERGNILEHIRGDIPVSRVPWESAFRTISARHLTRERKKTNRKPAGSMLSHEAMGGGVIWEPGRMRSPQPKALIIADSSGSVSMDMYLDFLGELSGMRRRTNATLLFALADTTLGQVKEIKQTTNLRTLSLDGRGGTCFIEPLQRAEEMDVDLVIYMTDMDGPFPDKCKVPVIWVTPKDRGKTAPFGRVIEI